MTELNDLKEINQFTDEGQQARKDFYEKWFDVDFFIKTYAVFILVGMDDDYWGNANNYYLYFDNGKKGSGKCYLIPFDFDNTLGKSINGDKVYTNPFEWGNGKDRPLLDRLFEVPEYSEKMKNTLLKFSSQEPDCPWNKNRCIALWNKWHAQVKPYVYSKDIAGWPDISSLSVDDSGGWKDQKHYVTKTYSNIYDQVTQNLQYWLSKKNIEIKFDLNGGSLNGQEGIVARNFNGINSKLDSIIGSPELESYNLLGWTKTKDGTDYIENFDGEDNITLFASWKYTADFSGLSIFEIKDSSYEGIKIGIINLPENHYRRTFYINGKEVGGDSFDNANKYKQIWAYPFTEPGKTYELYVSYSDKEYHKLETSNILKITADSGIGEFKVTNKPEFYIENNILKWKKEPSIQLDNDNPIREDNNWDEYYLLEVQSTKEKGKKEDRWHYLSWNYMRASCNTNFNFKDHVNYKVLSGNRYDLCFRLRYVYNSSPYGDLCLVIFDYNDMEKFNIK